MSCANTLTRNEQDNQHEDDQEHDCPSGERTETSTIVYPGQLASLELIYDPIKPIA
jgi:hypothetical protein